MRTIALAILAALAAAPAQGFAIKVAHTATKVAHPSKKAKHRKHRAPRTPRIKPGIAVPLAPAPPTTPSLVAEAPTPAPEPAVEPAQQPAPTLPRTVSVSATEFRLTLSRPAVGAGLVTVELRNKGEDGHDLHIDAAGGLPVAAWDELAALSAPVTKIVALTPGSYRLYCSLPGHAEAGMDTQLTVAQ